MKYKLLWYVLVLCSVGLQAQVPDVEGTWEGVLTQPDDSRSLANSYPFTLSLVQQGGRLTGYSRIEITGTQNYAIMELSGVTRDQSIALLESRINAQKIKGGFWCIKKENLKYSNADESLTGTWQAPNCGKGEIKVFRMNDGSKAVPMSGGGEVSGER